MLLFQDPGDRGRYSQGHRAFTPALARQHKAVVAHDKHLLPAPAVGDNHKWRIRRKIGLAIQKADRRPQDSPAPARHGKDAAPHDRGFVQSVPILSPTQSVQMVKSITVREIFRREPLVRKQLWSGSFWSSGFLINTVGHHGSEDAIRRYVQEQGTDEDYKTLHTQPLDAQQMELF